MQVAELFAALLGVGSAQAGEAVAAAGVLQRALALFLQFPFNNILHAQVLIQLDHSPARRCQVAHTHGGLPCMGTVRLVHISQSPGSRCQGPGPSGILSCRVACACTL